MGGVMNRIAGFAVVCFLSAFFVFFLSQGIDAPAGVGFYGPLFCYLIAAAFGAAIIVVILSIITGKDIF